MDFNSQKSNYTSPCQNSNVICVAANAPVGICPGPCDPNNVFCLAPGGLNFAGANYSRLASYSNYGRAVDVTAPGGDYADFPKPCFFDDFIATTAPNGGTSWVSGTSFSAPHVSALAALYIQKAAMDKGVLESELCNPNRVKTFVSPAQIKTAIMRGAVLPPGNAGEMRRIFGAGIINVPRTLGL
ncbi:hypothetical protein HYH03_018884 [Edaphochlamys debaryana]|nr:hypothetical protein HYH03_018884 [Edaphochlamys debaryana]|eukprot:KAG2482167.1 hypothetical protein HYH03_018884 [Edaphochlamys debaryana]